MPAPYLLLKQLLPVAAHEVPGQPLARHVAGDADDGAGGVLPPDERGVQGVAQVPAKRQVELLGIKGRSQGHRGGHQSERDGPCAPLSSGQGEGRQISVLPSSVNGNRVT